MLSSYLAHVLSRIKHITDLPVAMEIQLPWQQGNFAITQLNESILGSKLAHMFFVIKGSTGLSGCSGNTVAMATRKLYNNSAI